MKMIVNGPTLTSYLNKVIGSGSASVSEANFRITQSGISCKAMDPTGTRFVLATLKAQGIDRIEIENEFTLPITDLEFFQKVLDRFKGKVKIETKDNKLLLSDETRTAQIVIPDQEFIRNEKTPTLEIGAGFVVKADIFKSAIKDAALLKDTAYELKIKDNNLYVSVGEDNFNKLTERNEVQYQDMRIKFKCGFDSVFSALSGDVNVVMKDEYPLVVDWTDNAAIQVRNILAPLMETKEA